MSILNMSRERNTRVAVLVLSLGVGMLVGLNPGGTQANQQLPMMTIGYQSGMITGVHYTNLEIDRQLYSLTPDVVIVDEKGKQLDASSIRVDAEVKFHLKTDEHYKIDKLVVILPR